MLKKKKAKKALATETAMQEMERMASVAARDREVALREVTEDLMKKDHEVRMRKKRRRRPTTGFGTSSPVF